MPKALGVTGYEIWRMVRVHFKNNAYDLHKYGLKKVAQDDILNNPKIGVFQKFEKQFNFIELDMFQSLVANYVLGDFSYPFEFTHEHRDVWLDWLKRKQAITQVFSDDLNKLELGAIQQDPYKSQLFKLAISGQVSPESIVILDDCFRFLEPWGLILENSLHDEPVRIWTKYRNFVKYDPQKIRRVIKSWKPQSLNGD